MFGKNAVAKPYPDKDGKLTITEVFETLQGEGPQAGWPSVFVRLTACNLRCWFCDTDFERGREYTVSELLDQISQARARNRSNLVVITGGEPLLQNIIPLVAMLTLYHIRVSIETAGTLYVKGMDQFFGKFGQAHFGHSIVCSPKTPKINPDLEPLITAYKYIVQAGHVDADGFPNASTQAQGAPIKLFRPPADSEVPIYYQPMDEYEDAKNAANLEAARDLAMTYGRRLSVQMHKLANLP